MILCFLLAWGFWVIPLSAVASFVATVLMKIHSDEMGVRRLAPVGLGLLTSGTAFAAGLDFWLRIAVTTCHGGHECPF